MPDDPTTLLLVRHAPTPASRSFRFPVDEELDETGRLAAGALAGQLVAARAVTSPARRCRETARIAGFPDAEVDPALAELVFGRWAGRDPHDLWERDRERIEAWYRDPSSGHPDGGETFEALRHRVVDALGGLLAAGGRTVVFTHGGPIKIAVLHALGAPPCGMWHVDISPCSVTEVRARYGGGWELKRCNVPIVAAPSR